MALKRLALAILAGCTAPTGPLTDVDDQSLCWIQNFGGEASDQGLALRVDPEGALTVLGESLGPLSIGPLSLPAPNSASALFVARFTPWGAPEALFGFPGGQTALVRMDADSRGIVLGGAFFGDRLDIATPPLLGEGLHDAFIVALTPSGQLRWARRFGDPQNQFGVAIALGPDGSVWLAGRFEGQLAGMRSLGGSDIFLLQLSAEGELLTTRSYGGTGDDTASALTISEDGDAVLAGLISVEDEGRSVMLTRVQPGGRPLWRQDFGTPQGRQEVATMTIGPQGELLFAGTFTESLNLGPHRARSRGRTDIFLAALDVQSNLLFARPFGGPDFDVVRTIARDEAGRVWLTGSFKDSLDLGDATLRSDGSNDIFLAAFEAEQLQRNGPSWARSFGAPDSDQVSADLAIDPQGHALLLGAFEAELQLDDQRFVSAGDFDVTLACFR